MHSRVAQVGRGSVEPRWGGVITVVESSVQSFTLSIPNLKVIVMEALEAFIVGGRRTSRAAGRVIGAVKHVVGSAPWVRGVIGYVMRQSCANIIGER